MPGFNTIVLGCKKYGGGLGVFRDGTWSEAVRAAASLAYYEGDLARAIELAEQDVAVRRELGDLRELANSLGNLGLALKEVGEGPRSRDAFEECIALARDLADRRILALNLSSLSLLATQEGDPRGVERIVDGVRTRVADDAAGRTGGIEVESSRRLDRDVKRVLQQSWRQHVVDQRRRHRADAHATIRDR